nr:ribonuclease H-like domain-containing protein [Tanacetum cinerariifolium]
QNGVAERRNKTLIEVARTMLADSKLPTTFRGEAISTACYVQNRVLVVKPQNRTPYELFYGRTPMLSFMRPFGCPITILNTIDHLGTKDDNNAGQARKKKEHGKDYILLPLWTANPPFPQEPKSSQDAGFKPSNDVGNKVNEVPRQENECKDQEEKDSVNSTNKVNAVSSTVNAASNEVNAVGRKSSIKLP